MHHYTYTPLPHIHVPIHQTAIFVNINLFILLLILFLVFNQVSKKSWFYFTYRGQVPSSEDEMWIYYTIHSLVGVQIHFSHSGHVTHLDRIRSGKYYSASTVDSMESSYLARITELKRRLSQRDQRYLDVTTKIVIEKVGQKRTSCRFTRTDKIHNKTGNRSVQ